MATPEVQAQGGNENLSLLHKQLISDKYAVPSDLKEFEDVFKNPDNSKALFDQLVTDKYAIPEDYNSFVSTFGLKKKESPSDYSLPDTETISKVIGSTPQNKVTPPKELTQQQQRDSIKFDEETLRTGEGLPTLKDNDIKRIKNIMIDPDYTPSDKKLQIEGFISKEYGSSDIGARVAQQIWDNNLNPESIKKATPKTEANPATVAEVPTEAPKTPSIEVETKFNELLANSKQPKNPFIQPADATAVATQLKPLPEVPTLGDYLKERGVTLKDVGLPENINPDRQLRDGEQEGFESLLKTKGVAQAPPTSYFWGAGKEVHRVVSTVFRDLDDASKTLSDITGLKRGGAFKDIADFVDERSQGIMDMPNTEVGRLLSGGIGLEPLFAEMAISPKFKIGKIFGKTLNASRFLTQMVGKGFVNKYAAEVDKGGENKALLEGLKGAGEGALTATVFTKLGYGSSKLGEAVAKATESGVAGGVANAIANSAGFAGFTFAEQAITGQPIDADAIRQSAELGALMAIPQFAQFAGMRAMGNYLTSSPAAEKAAKEMTLTPTEARDKAFDIREQAHTETDIQKQASQEAAANTIDALADVKVISEEVKKDPAPFLESIEKSEIPDEQQKILTDKVKKTAAEDISTPEIDRLQEEIDGLKQQEKGIKDNENIPETVRKIKTEPIKEQIKAKEEAIRDIVTPKPEAPKPEDTTKKQAVDESLSALEEAVKPEVKPVEETEPEPIIAYHGTDKSFTDFDNQKIGSTSGNTGFFGDGFYFTNDKEVAGRYGGNKGNGRVVEAQLSINKPFELFDSDEPNKNLLNKSRKIIQSLTGLTEAETKNLNSKIHRNATDLVRGTFTSKRFKELLKENGFDGVIVRNSEGSMNADEYIVFDKSQIKTTTAKPEPIVETPIEKPVEPELNLAPEAAPVPEEVKQETKAVVTKKLDKQSAIRDDKIFKEQKNKMLDDLIAAEDLLLGTNKKKARDIEKSWAENKVDRETIDMNVVQFYEHKLDALPKPIEAKLNKLGIKVKDGKLVVDIYKDGTMEVGDIRSALRIIDKEFPARIKNVSTPSVPTKVGPSKYRKMAEEYGSLAESERRVKMAESNLAEAKRTDRTKKVGKETIPIPVNKGLVKTMEEQLSEVKAIHEQAKKVDYTQKEKNTRMDSDKEFEALWNEFKDHFGYENIGREQVFDIIEKQGRPKDLTYDTVQPLVIKDRLERDKMTILEKRTELESRLSDLEKEKQDKFGRKDGAGFKKPANKRDEWVLRTIDRQTQQLRSQLIDLQKYEPAIKKLYEEKNTNKPNTTTGKEEGNKLPSGTEPAKGGTVKESEAKPVTTTKVETAPKSKETKSILNQTKDLLGETKAPQWMELVRESDLKASRQGYTVHQVEAIRNALTEKPLKAGRASDKGKMMNKFDRAIAEGRMTKEDAKAIIESAGFKSPDRYETSKELPPIEPVKEIPSTEKKIEEVKNTGEKKIEVTKDGIKYGDKTYTDIGEVQDDYADKKLTFDEQRDLGQKVREYEQDRYNNPPLTDKPEELAWDQPLPISTKEDPNFKNSDLNNAMSIRNLGRNLIKNIGLIEGADVRTGLIKRLSRKARGLFNLVSGIIRVNNIRDLRALTHEIGHKLDFEIFDIRGIISASKSNPQLGNGVDFNGETYSDIAQVEKAMKDHAISIADGNYLLDEVKKFIKDKAKEKYSEIVEASKIKGANLNKLRAKYGSDVVDGVLQRTALKKEFRQLLKDVGYPSKKREEGIAEFVYNYVIDPKQVINSTPNALAWFEKLLDNAPEIKNALHQLRQDFAEYDAQDVLTKGVAETKTPEPEKTSWLGGIVKLGKNANYNIVNMLYPLESMVKKWKTMMDNNTLAYKDPWISAKQLLGNGGRIEQWLVNHPYFNRENDVDIKKDIKGLLPILQPILGTDKYEPYKTYLVALDAIESHNRQLPQQAFFDKETALAIKATAEKRYGAATLQVFQTDIQKYNETLLDFAAESGKISQETADYWKHEHQNYVPLRRIAETYEVFSGKKKITRDLLPDSEKVIFARKGSTKSLKDVFESMIENTAHIIASGERNLLNRNLADMFKDIHEYNKNNKTGGAVIEEINASDMEAYQDATTGEIRYAIKSFRPKNFRPPKGRILTVYEQGKPRFYDVAPEYYDDIFKATTQVSKEVSKIMRIFSLPSRILQAGAVVYDPTFPVRNIIRDQSSTWFTSKHGYLPTDFVKGFSSAIKKNEIYQKWLASGGDQSFLVSADEALSKEFYSTKINKVARKKFESYARNPLKALQDLSKYSEIGTRLGAFKNAYKKTGNIKLAAIESRDITADYGIHGAITRQAFSLYPFLNARIQWMRTIGNSMKNPSSFLLKGMALTVPAVLNWLINNQDDESRQLYQSLPTWRRVGLYNIRIPGTEHFLPLPKGFYGVVFGSSVEALLDSVVKDDPRVAGQFFKQFFQEISPIGNWPEVIPFIARPAIEMWANKKGYTGKPIVSESMKLLKPSEQFYNGTPEIIKKMGEALNWSPVKIQHYFNSYTGGAGAGAVNIFDEILQQLGVLDRKPEDTFTMLSRMPVFKALLTEKPIGLQSGYISDFYDTLDKITKVNVTFNKLVATNSFDKLEQFMADPDNQRMYSFYEGNSTAINSFRNALGWVRDQGYAVMKDPLLSKQQRQDEIAKMNEIVQETVLQFKDAYENKKPFEYGKAMDEIVDKMKQEKKDSRYDLVTQSNIYNPYWMQLRKDNTEVFDLLKEFGGLRDIKQTKSLNIKGKKVDLELEDVRLFNETVVGRYGKNIKTMLGTDKSKWEGYQKELTPEESSDNELQRILIQAWDEATTQTQGDFKPQYTNK